MKIEEDIDEIADFEEIDDDIFDIQEKREKELKMIEEREKWDRHIRIQHLIFGTTR